MHDLETLDNFYLSRFGRLPVAQQDKILEHVDAGGSVITRYDTAAGSQVCFLTGDPALALWEDANSPTEGKALGSCVKQILDTMPRERQEALDDALEGGAQFVVLHKHTAPRKTEVYLEQDGKYTFFAKLADLPHVHH